MPQTLTVVHVPVGGAAADHPEVVAAVTEAAQRALASGSVTDSRAMVGGGTLSLVALHGAGERDAEVHRALWDALEAGTQAARAIGSPGLGDALPVDAFHGSLRGTGLSYAEIVMMERPSGPLVVLLATESPVGMLNLPLAKAFANPFTTPRLVTEPTMRRGFNFEVHDLDEPRKRMFAAPSDLHDLLRYAAEMDRYVIKSVVTGEGVVVAAASVERRADVLGEHGGDDWPVAIVRAGGDGPTVDELMAAFRPHIVQLPGGWVAPTQPRVLAFHVAGERLLDPVDLFADPSFDGLLRAQGPFIPRADAAGSGSEGTSGGWTER